MGKEGLGRCLTLLQNPKPGLNTLGELLASQALQPFHQLIDATIWSDPVADGELIHPEPELLFEC
jgi:hypothetical protein